MYVFNISDVPSRPIGPLEVTDVTSNSANLSWKAPEKDGGSPLINYIIEYKLASRTFWAKAGTCNAKCTTFNVTNLMEDSDYFFRVMAVNKEGQSLPLETLDSTRPTKKLSKSMF